MQLYTLTVSAITGIIMYTSEACFFKSFSVATEQYKRTAEDAYCIHKVKLTPLS